MTKTTFGDFAQRCPHCGRVLKQLILVLEHTFKFLNSFSFGLED